MTELLLASASPRRADLLRQLGVSFSVQGADIDETRLDDEPADSYVQRLAREKAAAVAGVSGHAGAVLAADTCVVLGDELLGKPVDRMDAIAMLARLSGRDHHVVTGVCLQLREERQECISQTRVSFVSLDRETCEAYVDTGEPYDKAGGYGIQGVAGAFVSSIEGSYSGVVGLPLAETWQMLRLAGIGSALRVDVDE